jgi:hypothetical protein
MCRWLAVLIALGGGALVGCASDRSERSTARLHAPAFTGPVGEDVVFIDVATIERTPGDPFLNQELWSEADEQTVRADGDEQGDSLERKTALEKNGFRVGQVGGGLLPPSKLQDLLLSKRSCQAHRIQLHAGNETTIPLGPPWPRCVCALAQDGQTVAVDLPKAQCLLVVVPSLADDGRIRLRFTPHLKHGEVQTTFAPLRDADGVLRWDRQDRQAEEAYPWLSWTVTVAPNEYVVIGTNLDNGDTLGEQFFLSGDDRPLQRLLVLRTARMPAPSGPADEKLSRSPPLALRASWTSERGRGE